MSEENISDYGNGIDEEDETLIDEIKKPYDPSKIQVDPKPMTLFEVMRKIELGEINLQPDFQRHIIWDEVRQSRLIESILIGIPLPAFYLDARDDDEWLVVDGLQRLSTLNKFFNQKKLHLTQMEFLTELNNKNFDDLPRKMQRNIEDARLNLYVIKPDTPEEVKFTIFYRINTGGMVLSPQEIRHCLFQGKSTTLLKELAESEEFLKTTTNSINSKRMDDRNCILRYLAFHLESYKGYREPDLNKFLIDTMKNINKMGDNDIDKLRKKFFNAMKISREVFGKYAFRKMFKKNANKNPVNKSLFEVWSVCLEQLDPKALIANRDKIIDLFIEAMNKDNEYMLSITQSTGNVKKVEKRFTKTLEIITEALK